MEVIVYTTATCPFCNMLINYLREKNINFSEKKVDTDKEAEKEMMESSGGFLGVPYTVVKKDGNTEAVIGFDKNKLESIFGS